MAYIVKKGHENLIYVGVDPITQIGSVKIRLGDMTKEQIEAWAKLNPVTCLQHLDMIIDKANEKNSKQ